MKTLPITSVELPSLERPDAPSTRVQGPDFDTQLGQLLSGVETLQLEADDEAAKAALGGGNLHELSLALEKADIAMRVATKVRNKVVDAYHEIMRMSV